MFFFKLFLRLGYNEKIFINNYYNANIITRETHEISEIPLESPV